MDAQKIGQFIQEKRKEKNMSQEELANKIYVSNKTISKWENARGVPSVELLMPLCEVLDVELKVLLTGTKDEPYEELLIKEMKKRKKVNIAQLVGGIIICILLCFLEGVLYLANVADKYGYIIFGLIIVIFFVADICFYYMNRK